MVMEKGYWVAKGQLQRILRNRRRSITGRAQPHEEPRVHQSDERMIVILLVGAAVGYLAGRVVRGSGFGLVGDSAVGVIGSLLGNWLLPRFGVHFIG